ncbi:MAG TPA: 2-methylfumaryl-CoA isomerase, partial [Stellaceae bacterium]|nr:2-methylfumaryl-CoA isomerase [Stellaceae bacterium]
LFAEVDQPGIGSYLAPGLPLDFSAAPRQPTRPAPLLGQHTDQVLAEVLGLSAVEIGRLHDAGVAAGPAN